VRHLYDLYAIDKNHHIKENFFKLVYTVIVNDSNQFKNQHPEYAMTPADEIIRSMKILKNTPLWESRYQSFIEAMVFDRNNFPNYKIAIEKLEHISAKVLKSLELATA